MLFIYNPCAGKGRIKTQLHLILDRFTRAGHIVTAYPTQGVGDARAIAAQLGGKYERVVCCGGDGTLSETLNGLMQRKERPSLGYIPMGSMNDFSKNLRLPRSIEKRADTAALGVLRPCDVGHFCGQHPQYFIYVAAFGAFTEVSYHTNQQFKNMLGHIAYILQGAAMLTALQAYKMKVTHDGTSRTGEFLYGMVSNSVSVAGLKFGKRVSVALDDGEFEVLLIQKPKTTAELQSLIGTLLVGKLEEHALIWFFRAKRISFACGEDVPWTLDGEYGGKHRTIAVENEHRALSVVHGI